MQERPQNKSWSPTCDHHMGRYIISLSYSHGVLNRHLGRSSDQRLKFLATGRHYMLSSVGRAFPCKGECRRFDSGNMCHTRKGCRTTCQEQL